MKISVIIPSYKPQGYLWECLDSICGQTFDKEAFEVILVLNGCKEPFESEIIRYIADHPGLNWNFIQTDQGGVSNARNIGIEHAKGDYLTFIDDDDYVSETYLQEMYDIALQGYTPLSNVVAFNDGDDKPVPYYITDCFMKGKDSPQCGLMQVRSLLSVPVAKLLAKGTIGTRRFNTRFALGEDSLFVFSVSDKIAPMKCTSEHAVYYRRYREGSAVTKKYSTRHLVGNALSLCRAYTAIVLRHPLAYNIPFYLTRVAGSFKTVAGMLKKR